VTGPVRVCGEVDWRAEAGAASCGQLSVASSRRMETGLGSGHFAALGLGKTGNPAANGDADRGTAVYPQGLTAEAAAPSVLTPRHLAGILYKRRARRRDAGEL